MMAFVDRNDKNKIKNELNISRICAFMWIVERYRKTIVVTQQKKVYILIEMTAFRSLIVFVLLLYLEGGDQLFHRIDIESYIM